jgi:hypothetical protein
MRDASIEDSRAANSPQALESKIDFLENVARFCAVVVIGGVVLEYLPKFIAFGKAPRWALFKDLSGGLLIALGIAGEVLASMLSSRKEQQLRDLNARTVAELNLRAEQERLARVKLEARLADRRVSFEQRSIIGRELSQFTGRVLRLQVINDNEAICFCNELTPAFDRAGITVFPPEVFPPGGIDRGLVLNGVGEKAELFAAAIESAFLLAGVVTDPIPRMHLNQEGQLTLRIGPK